MEYFTLTNTEYTRLLNDFNRFVIVRGYGNGRAVPYQMNLKEFLYFMTTQKIEKVVDITAKDILNYYEYLKKRPKLKGKGRLSSSTIKSHLFTIRIFFDYLLETDELIETPIHLPKFQWGEYTERNICSKKEIKLLYDVCFFKIQ